MSHDVKTKTIHLTRIINAPRAKVWAAWTEPEQIKKWWGPEGFTAPNARLDLREGGKFFYSMKGPEGTEWNKEMWSGGEFLEIIPMEKIVATDHFADAEGNFVTPEEFGMPGVWPKEPMKVTVTFEDTDDGKTKLTLMHEGHPESMAADATAGWNGSLDKFESLF